jgi:hypothetical protein
VPSVEEKVQVAPSILTIEARIAPLRAQLARHPLYASMQTEQHLRIFMHSHVFAVWDFMSLLKSLQSRLTCVTIPWTPSPFPESRRFINEIVLGEESDLYEGRAISHFELYLEAMECCGADTEPICALLVQLEVADLASSLQALPTGPKAFVESTFRLIERGRLHALAAAFTFGREDLIPEMFRSLVLDMDQRTEGSFATFIWYLERHIEVDGDDHGPLSLRMVADICGEDPTLWEEAAQAAEQAIAARLKLWDDILAEIRQG